MMNLNSVRSFVGLSSVLVIAGSSFACSAAAGEGSVGAHVETIDRTHQALSTGALQWANGTYGSGCTERTGAWSARISGATAMDHAPVSVVKNNAGCTLTLTGLVADDWYLGDRSIAMSGAYATTGSAFAVSGGNIAFYANAELSSTAFADDFTMTILFSDNLKDTNPSVTATYASVSGTAMESQLLSPSYTADFTGMTLQTDQGGVVQLASGNVTMTVTNGGQSGEKYVINTDQSLGGTFADIDAAYAAVQTPATLGSTIAVSVFGLGGAQLATVRNIIISHTDSGVTAYEVIRVTFNAP